MNRPAGRRATVRWVGWLFGSVVLLQRFAVPGVPDVALLLPIMLCFCGFGVLLRILTFERRRLAAWLLAAGSTAVAIQLQLAFVGHPLISVGSWALFMLTWLPFTLRLVHSERRTFVDVLDVVFRITTYLAAACIVMLGSQLAGIGYRDWLAALVPDSFLLHGFVITYPVAYGSEIMRANAWIGLEPSIVSALLGVGVLSAILVGAPWVRLLVLLGGLFATVSGSGFAIVAAGLLVMALSPVRRSLRSYLLPTALLLIVAANSKIGSTTLQRVTEVSSNDSSTSLRAVMPYQYLFPQWNEHLLVALLGRGPGSSQDIVTDSGILGLLVPTPVKIFFDYGLLAGLVLAGFLLLCYAGGYSRALSVSLLLSLWLLQPGTTTVVIIMPVLLLVTLWAPSREAALESLPGGGEPVHRRVRPSGGARSKRSGAVGRSKVAS